jgi:ubiquinone/menaquinone biosynthesis C-methylase UbiE
MHVLNGKTLFQNLACLECETRTMNDYYSEQLASNNLKRCYDIAPPRVKQYLQAEVKYVLEYLHPSDVVIELGCGYGRVLKELLTHSFMMLGIDTSLESLRLALEYMGNTAQYQLLQVDAARLPLENKSVDKVICIQNGISAFKIDPLHLIKESVRVTRRGGCCLFSSYSKAFWQHRLDWFKLQSDEGLIGEIDWTMTSDGVIVCKDGFKATTISPADFASACNQLRLNATICEVDESSIFCRILV